MKWTEEIISTLSEKAQQNVREALVKHGDNHWWELDDLRIVAYYQIKENILMLDFSQYHKGIELLLGHPVWTHDFALNRTELIDEAEKAYALIQSGESTEISLEDKAKKAMESMDRLRTFAEKNNKKIIGIVTSD